MAVVFKVKGLRHEVLEVKVDVAYLEMFKSIKGLMLGRDDRYLNHENQICHDKDGLHDDIEVVDIKDPDPELIKAYDALKVVEDYFKFHYKKV